MSLWSEQIKFAFIPDFSNNLSISFSFMLSNLQIQCDKKMKITVFLAKTYI